MAHISNPDSLKNNRNDHYGARRNRSMQWTIILFLGFAIAAFALYNSSYRPNLFDNAANVETNTPVMVPAMSSAVPIH